MKHIMILLCYQIQFLQGWTEGETPCSPSESRSAKPPLASHPKFGSCRSWSPPHPRTPRASTHSLQPQQPRAAQEWVGDSRGLMEGNQMVISMGQKKPQHWEAHREGKQLLVLRCQRPISRCSAARGRQEQLLRGGQGGCSPLDGDR